MRYLNQTGAAPMLVLLAIVGVVAFLVLASGAPFKDKVLTSIYPKDESLAATTLPSCWPDAVPAGALPGQPKPIWCYTDYGTGPDTHVEGPNSWVDDFNHGLTLSDCCPGYTVYENQGEIGKSKHWRHANHWMIDVAGYNEGRNGAGGAWGIGGAMMRPNKAFRFEDFPNDTEGKKLVIETDVAAAIAAHGPEAWPEIVVSTSSKPTIPPGRETLYGYEQILGPGIWTFGCRLGNEGMICAGFDSRGGAQDHDGRLYEFPFHGVAGSTLWDDGVYRKPNPLRKCNNTDPDTNCRDRFRVELTKNSFKVLVNGYDYISMTNMPPEKQFSDEMLNGDVYVYLVNWLGRPQSDTIRFHWDRIAVNPKDAQGNLAGLSAPADFCIDAPNGVCPIGGSTPTPAVSATPAPTSTPAASSFSKPGDVDGNNKIDIFDFNQVLSDFGKTGTSLISDVEKSGTSLNKVDIFDYNLLLTNFGR